MSDTSQGPGWWQASDGKWYPPEQAPGGSGPGGGGSVPPTPGAAGGGGVDIGGSISYGWNKFTQNLGPLIVAVLLVFIVDGIVGGIGTAFNSWFLQLVWQLIGVVIGAVVTYGLITIALKIVNGETPEFGDVVPSGPMVGNYAVTAIIVQIITAIGFYLCIIPGIIAATFLLFAHFAVLDEGLAPGDAIKRSIDLVKPNFGGVLGFMVVAFLINVVGVILCCVGLFATWPLTIVAGAYVYKGLKGQPVAA